MYSKVYQLSANPDLVDSMWEHYDSVLTPAIKASEHHAGHHMVESGPGRWVLVSNYHSKESAEEAVPLVQQLLKPMAEQFDLTLDVIAQGEVIRTI